MTKNKMIMHIFAVIIALLPMLYIAMIWNTLPDIIPTHFGSSGKPNAYGPKSTIWFMGGLFAGVSLLAYALLTNMNKIDPKRVGQPNAPVFGKLAFGMIFFFAALNFIIAISTTGQTDVIKVALVPIIGLMFAFIGNLMHNIKPNYFAGIRIPWTLSSDENWRKTHQLAGKMWFAGGLLITILSLFIHKHQHNYILLPIALIISLVPIIYSFLLFRKEQAEQREHK